MKKTNDLDPRGGINDDDKGISEELESLYQRVAQFDESAVSSEKISAAHQHNQYHREGTDLENNGDRDRSLPKQEELLEKLLTIKEAYEKILTYWPYSCTERRASPNTREES